MSRHGEINLIWGSDERTFRLGIGEWRKVQEKCDAGPGEIVARLGAFVEARRRMPSASLLSIVLAGGLGNWRVDDQREVLYQGLIGGGSSPTEAGKLLKDLFDSRPLTENISIALQVALASIVGVEDEPLGEEEGAPKVSQTVKSPSETT